MRARTIKPSIMTNEDLAELGPLATLLYERLWMIADRAGRFENRPKRIKAMCFPLWDDVCGKDVENLMISLWKSGFLVLYSIEGVAYGQIQNWEKHQNVHPREASSTIPPPPGEKITQSVRDLRNSNEDQIVSEPCKGTAEAMPYNVPGNALQLASRAFPSFPSLREVVVKEEVVSTIAACAENEDPPASPLPPSAKKRTPPKRKEAGKAKAVTAPGERPPAANGAVDFWPHSGDDIDWLRSLLIEIGKEARLAPPDDVILRRVLDAGGGAGAGDIYRVLRRAWQRGKFRSMHSYGLIPQVTGTHFRAA